MEHRLTPISGRPLGDLLRLQPRVENALAELFQPQPELTIGNILAQALVPQPSLGGLLAGTRKPPALVELPPGWVYVRPRFTALLEAIKITVTQGEEGDATQAAVRRCLNRHYWDVSSGTANSLLTGSWAKFTRVRPSSDVDLTFLLPGEVYWRYQRRAGNRQSQLLQEVKNVLAATYPRTAMRGDRQVVVVPFDHVQVEVAPGFRCQDGSIIVCDAKDDGRYRISTAEVEAIDLARADNDSGGDVRALARMIKLWKRERNVPLKSFVIERLAVEFLRGWRYAGRGPYWYDWMVRDFLAYLVVRANDRLFMPGTGEVVWLGSDWLSRAQIAQRHATIACVYEEQNCDRAADEAWRQIFGAMAR